MAAMVLVGYSCCRRKVRAALVAVATAADPVAVVAGPEALVGQLLPRMRKVILHLLTETTDLWVREHSFP